MKRHARTNFWIAVLIVVSVLGLGLFWLNRTSSNPPAVSSAPPTQQSATPELGTNAPPALPVAGQAAEAEPARRVEGEPTLAMIPIAQLSPVAEPPPPATATVQGYGEAAVLSDQDGKPLLKATEIAPIYSAKPSPSGKQVVISRGNGVHEIYRLEPFELVRQLPLMPDIPRASAFGPWNWLDETTLIGAVDIARPAAELTHLTGAEKESPENWREQTLLYSFDLADGKLKKIDTARAGLPSSFTVIEMHTGGLVKVEWDEQGTSRTAWVAARGE